MKAEAWPDPRSAEEVHEALCWMGYVTVDEASDWMPWIVELVAAGRVERDGDRFFAIEATRDPVAVWRGRLEALGPVFDDDLVLHQLVAEGSAVQVRIAGRDGFCDRRLLHRIQRYTLDRLRQEIQP